jgi:hypothetical protein
MIAMLRSFLRGVGLVMAQCGSWCGAGEKHSIIADRTTRREKIVAKSGI